MGTWRREGIECTLHRPHPAVLEEEPVVGFKVFTGPRWVADFVLGVVAFNEVLHDATGLEQSDLLPVGELVRQGGDTPVGVER